MRWQEWRPTYEAIVADLALDPAADDASARRLRDLLDAAAGQRAWRVAEERLRGRPAVVVGCGPSLNGLEPPALVGQAQAGSRRQGPDGGEERKSRRDGMTDSWENRRCIVAADGASTRLMEIGVLPDIVVTDLDGAPEGLAWAASGGAVLLVHAHGDNADRLGAVPGLARRGPVAGTCQGDPNDLAPLRNLGGFTDGDRAVLLCEALGSTGARLAAFDLDAAPSRYSHRFDPARKPRKLAWAARILDDAARRFPIVR